MEISKTPFKTVTKTFVKVNRFLIEKKNDIKFLDFIRYEEPIKLATRILDNRQSFEPYKTIKIKLRFKYDPYYPNNFVYTYGIGKYSKDLDKWQLEFYRNNCFCRNEYFCENDHLNHKNKLLEKFDTFQNLLEFILIDFDKIINNIHETFYLEIFIAECEFIISKQNLIKQIELLKLHNKYLPKAEGYFEAKEHFQSIQN